MEREGRRRAMALGQSGLKARKKIGDGDSFLLHRIAVPKGDGIFLTCEGTLFCAFEGFEIDGDTEGGADLVLPAIAPPHRALLVVEDGHVRLERFVDIAGHLGHIVGCAGTEALTRALAAELGTKNIRVLCVRSHAIADAVQAGSHVGAIFAARAQAMGITVEQFLGGAAQSTLTHRLPTLAQVADTIAFLASDAAGAMTGTTVNMTAGAT